MSARKVFELKVGVVGKNVLMYLTSYPKSARGGVTLPSGMKVSYGPRWVCSLYGADNLFLGTGIFANDYDLVFWRAGSNAEAIDMARRISAAVQELNMMLFGVTNEPKPEVIILA